MSELKKHFWNKRKTETLLVAELQAYLAQFDPSTEIYLGVVQMRGDTWWKHPVKGLKFVFGEDKPAMLAVVGKPKRIRDGDRNG